MRAFFFPSQPALGTQAALTVIVCGSVLGAGLLGPDRTSR